MSLIKTNIQGYYKDPKTNTVVNENHDEYSRFRAQLARHEEYVKTKNELAELKKQVEEIKQLLIERAK